MEGLDIGEHGMEAYSGFVKESDIVAGSYYASSVDMETPSTR
jgi:Amt family ammonium transporter